MRSLLPLTVPALTLAFTLSVSAAALDLGKDLDIPFQKFVLKNGLTLVVHEDHKAPIVAVNVWYHVGSKNEKPGKTGFAHLFEHLMFNGSEHFDDDYFKAMEKVGATDLNGTTNEDRTNYFENAPKDALDFLLWMESDRMGHLLGAISQEKLDEQRGVVQNEKRQGENQPYGIAYELITKGTAPAGHPYSWTVIGSMEDLNAASLDDVKEWFKTYYGAANATLVVAGDVNPEEVHKKVEAYFGDIPSGPPVVRQGTWIAKRTGDTRQVAQDRVPQARLYKVWNIPPYGSPESDYLNLASDVLALGKNSRLYKRLVYDEQVVTSIQAYIDLSEITGHFMVVATARPGESLEKIEKAIDEELARFLKDGPTRQELLRVKTQNLAGFIRGVERIGGFGGKSDILANNQVYLGDPGAWKQTLKRTREATAKQVRDTAREWLSDGAYILEIHPFPEYETNKTGIDRSKLPTPEIKPVVKFPELQRAELANGLRIVLAERNAIPVVGFDLIIDAGYAADQFAVPGTAQLSMNMLDEGTRKRDALRISEEMALLGAEISARSSLDSSSVSLSALKENLDASLELFADVVLNPSFPGSDFERLRKQQLDAIRREKNTPMSMALRVFPKFLYGAGHAYSNPFTGSGTLETVEGITPDDARKFHQTWFKPNNATLVVVGDTTLGEIVPRLEKLFSGWKTGEVPKKNISTVKNPEKPVIYVMDRPGAVQTILFAGQIAPPMANPDEVSLETMNNILGGTFTSRVNMNLREDKHWSYGAQSIIPAARGQRPYITYASVQTDKTKESIIELDKELRGIIGDKPPTADELTKSQQNQTLQLAGSWETMDSVSGSISEIVRFGLADNHFQTYPDRVMSLKLDDLARVARGVIAPDNLIWIVVGDQAKIEAGLRELGIGEIRLIDPDGKVK